MTPAAARDGTAVIFTEHLRGHMTPAGAVRDAQCPVQVTDLKIRVSLGNRTAQGGLPGQILGGTVAAPALDRESMAIRTGTIELLARAPDGEGRMTYQLEFDGTGSARYLLHGVKRLAARRWPTPRLIWRETSRLSGSIYLMPGMEPMLAGAIALQPRDFLTQMRSLHADPATDPDEAAVAVARFISAFTANATRIYLHRAAGRKTQRLQPGHPADGGGGRWPDRRAQCTGPATSHVRDIMLM